MRVSIHTPTGRVLGMQSHAAEETMRANAASEWPDLPAEEIDVREVDAKGYAALLAAQPVDLTAAREAKSAAIMVAFEEHVAAGVPYGGKVLQIRDADRNLITSNFGRAAAYLQQQANPLTGVTITWPPNGFPWRMLDDSFLLLTPSQFIDMAQQAADRYGALFYVRSALKDAVAAAETPEALASIDITTGWPA